MVNNMMEFFAGVPPMLVTAWAAWFIVGGALVLWYRRADDLEYVPAPAPRPVARPKPASRPPSGVRTETPATAPPAAVEESPLDDTSHLYEPPPALVPPAPRERKPVVIGDPFGDLATLLDQPQAAAAPAPPHRAPGDSPILSSSGSPIRRANGHEPRLG